MSASDGTLTLPVRRARTREVSRPAITVERCAWIDDDLLLLIAEVPFDPHPANEDALEQDTLAMALPRLDHRSGGAASRILALVQTNPTPTGTLPDLELTLGSTAVVVDGVAATAGLGDLRTLIRQGLAWMTPDDRAAVVAFLVQAAPLPARRAGRIDAPVAGPGARRSAGLFAVREALRERQPVAPRRDGPSLIVDSLSSLDDESFYLRGRIGIGALQPTHLTLVSPEGARIELLDRAYWYDLPGTAEADVSWRGFSVCATCPRSLRPAGWVVELETASGLGIEVAAPVVARDAAAVTRQVLQDLGQERLPAADLRRNHVRPALRRLQRRRLREASIDWIADFGTPPRAPETSVIVALYRRIDLIEHQLASFVDDPEMYENELIYVLDSPEMAEQLRDHASRLARLYPLPFRVVALTHNVGFAAANNFGASVARGRLLLLLNSDVFPESPGWLGEMARFHDSVPGIGAVGPKLLFEDEALQHAGMYFEQPQGSHLWNNEHFFKGAHRDLPAAAESRPVPAVTGACMMVGAKLYRSVGGLSGEYVQGDFEDSDLCLRLARKGRESWYFADVALYHLEGSSYDPERRQLHDGYNRWLHTHLWGRDIPAQCRRLPRHLPSVPSADPVPRERTRSLADVVDISAGAAS